MTARMAIITSAVDRLPMRVTLALGQPLSLRPSGRARLPLSGPRSGGRPGWDAQPGTGARDSRQAKSMSRPSSAGGEECPLGLC